MHTMQPPAQPSPAQPLDAQPQQTFGGDLAQQATNQLLGGLAAGMAGGMGGGLAAGMAGMAGGDNAAMQQVAAGAALNYLGGLTGKANSDVKTYTGSTLSVVRYYFQAAERRVAHCVLMFFG